MKSATLEEKLEAKTMDKVISKYRGRPGELLNILEDLQGLNPHKYLPKEVLEYVSQKTGVALSRIYSIVTFYTFFNLKPQGKHSIIVCRGTACHTRQSKILLESLEDMLGLCESDLKEGEKIFLTTKDNKFTVKTVACFGQCALAPVVEIDGQISSHMTTEKLRKIVEKISRGKNKK
jgi:NADH-quinone oxidoreductase subunit E